MTLMQIFLYSIQLHIILNVTRSAQKPESGPYRIKFRPGISNMIEHYIYPAPTNYAISTINFKLYLELSYLVRCIRMDDQLLGIIYLLIVYKLYQIIFYYFTDRFLSFIFIEYYAVSLLLTKDSQ